MWAFLGTGVFILGTGVFRKIQPVRFGYRGFWVQGFWNPAEYTGHEAQRRYQPEERVSRQLNCTATAETGRTQFPRTGKHRDCFFENR